jgi:hypothetical protein
MSKESISIEKYSSKYRKFGLNLTALKMLCIYVKDHPNKGGILLYDSTKNTVVDPVLSRIKEKEKIKKLFSSFSLYGIVLVNTNKDKYFYMGRYVNGTMLSIEVDKHKNEKHVPLIVSVVEMLEKVEEDFIKTYKNPNMEKIVSTTSDATDMLEQTIIKKEEMIGDLGSVNLVQQEESNTEVLKDFDFNQMRRNMTFNDLPSNLQKVIKETIPFSND